MPAHRKVNDRKASMTECYPPPDVVTVVIGPAMPNSIGHLFDCARHIQAIPSRHDACYSAHSITWRDFRWTSSAIEQIASLVRERPVVARSRRRTY